MSRGDKQSTQGLCLPIVCEKHLKKFFKKFKNLLTNRTKCAIIIMLRETKTRDTKMGAHK